MSDRVQKMPEGHRTSDGTTARRADDQQLSVGDVSVASRKPEQSAARYHRAVPMRQRRVKMMTLYLTRAGTSSQWRLSCIK